MLNTENPQVPLNITFEHPGLFLDGLYRPLGPAVRLAVSRRGGLENGLRCSQAADCVKQVSNLRFAVGTNHDFVIIAKFLDVAQVLLHRKAASDAFLGHNMCAASCRLSVASYQHIHRVQLIPLPIT